MRANCVFPAAVAKGAGPEVGAGVMENAAKTLHRATIIHQSQFKRFRTHRHRFGPGVHVVWGIKPKSKAGPRGGVVYVHALLFDRNKFSPVQAKAWLGVHGYKAIRFEAAPTRKVAARAGRRAGRAANMMPAATMFKYIASMNPVELMDTWMKAQKATAKPADNPSLMILMNPKKHKAGRKKVDSREVALANKAYKSFHFKDHAKQERHMVPDDWPRTLWVLGLVDRLDVKDKSGKVVSRTFRNKRPILSGSKERKGLFIKSRNGSLGVPSGTSVRIDYSVPKRSGRNKWAARWWHPQDSSPVVKVQNGGRYVKITGPGLSITPRGIIG